MCGIAQKPQVRRDGIKLLLSATHEAHRSENKLRSEKPGRLRARGPEGFQANQGLLLAGAVAYYALLSIVPLLILMVIALSQVIDQDMLLATLNTALAYVVPGEGKAVVAELQAFLDHREVIGWVLFITMLFFSSLGFKVLESAISVIFLHRVEKRKRHILVSLLVLPFGYIFFIGAVLFVGTFVIVDLMAIGGEHIVILGHSWSLGGFSRWLIYVAGVIGEILLISAILLLHAGGQVVGASRADRRRHGGPVVGTHPPCAGLVFRHTVAGERGVRLAHHGHHRAAEHGSGRHAAVAGRAGDCGIRAHRDRFRAWRAGAVRMNHQHLELLLTREMPYGKYKGRVIADLPGNYLNWFARKGFPPGELGQLLALMQELDHNGLSSLLGPLRKGLGANAESSCRVVRQNGS